MAGKNRVTAIFDAWKVARAAFARILGHAQFVNSPQAAAPPAAVHAERFRRAPIGSGSAITAKRSARGAEPPGPRPVPIHREWRRGPEFCGRGMQNLARGARIAAAALAMIVARPALAGPARRPAGGPKRDAIAWRVSAIPALRASSTEARRALIHELSVREEDGSVVHFAVALPLAVNARGEAQNAYGAVQINLATVGGTLVSGSLYDSGNTAMKVNCVVGCSAASSFSDNGVFTVGTTAINVAGALYATSTPSISAGNAGRVRMDANSYLYTDCVVGCSGGATTPSDAFANPTTAGLSFSFLAGFNGTTWDRLRDDVNKDLYVDVANASLAVTGTFWQATQPVSGTFWQTTQPVSVADAGDVTLGAKADAKSTATDTTAITAMQVFKEISFMEQNPASRAVTGTFWQATQPVSCASGATCPVNATLQSNSGVDIGKLDTDQTVVQEASATATNMTSTCYLTSAASTNSTNCKASAGNVYGIYVINTTTTNYFLRMYNASSAPTCSSATGFIETIPALGAAANGGGISRMQMAQGYSTGISFCLTGGGSSTDNTNAATGVYVTILYK